MTSRHVRWRQTHIGRDELGTFFRYLPLLLVSSLQGRQGLVAAPTQAPSLGGLYREKTHVEMRYLNIVENMRVDDDDNENLSDLYLQTS